MVARFILGASSPGIYGTSFVLVIEMVGPSWRGLAGNLFCLPFAFGYMALPAFAYFLRSWKTLQLVLSIPALLQIFVCWKLPESPRWLLRKGRVVEAEKLLRKMAEVNKVASLPNNFSESIAKIADLEKEVTVKVKWSKKLVTILGGYMTLIRSPKLRVRTLVIYFSWISISLVYYGVALNSPNLSTDRYLYTFISGALEIPSYFMVPPLIQSAGRRPVFSGLLLGTAVSLLTSLFFCSGDAMIVVLALGGKLLIGSAYALIYLYATEVMPTLLRSYGVGTASMVGRIGSASAPFIVDVMGRDDKTYPTIVFGTVSLIAGLLALLLPETKNRKLPETVQDVENDAK
jgi:OCT family organic cation transporter-like MFS transporter 4/5